MWASREEANTLQLRRFSPHHVASTQDTSLQVRLTRPVGREAGAIGLPKKRTRSPGDQRVCSDEVAPSVSTLRDGLEALSRHFREIRPQGHKSSPCRLPSQPRAISSESKRKKVMHEEEHMVTPLPDLVGTSDVSCALRSSNLGECDVPVRDSSTRVTSAPAWQQGTRTPISVQRSAKEACMTTTTDTVSRHDVMISKRSATPPASALQQKQSCDHLPGKLCLISPRAASKTTSPTKLSSPSSVPTPSAQRNRGGRIQVVVRKRPLPDGDAGVDCIRIDSPSVHTEITKQRVDLSEYTERSDYTFDDAFDETRRNEDVYRSCAKGLLDVALGGGSASCFAYGQTGSGKTHTMMGSQGERGLFLLGTADLFDRMADGQNAMVSFYEIYCNSLFDLLNRRCPVVLREDGNRRVNICGLSWHAIASADELWEQISSGMEQRSIGSTSANERSSRSHAIMSIRITDSERVDFLGMLNFVDLAGSERAADTATNDRQTRLEGAEINKSLLALKECIRALDEKKRHVPFRGSRLTEVLRDSFVGNSKTVMIANISPSSLNYEHTANTLRYAFRVKGLSIPSVAPSKARNAPRPTIAGRSRPSAAMVSPGRAVVASPTANCTPVTGKRRDGSTSLGARRRMVAGASDVCRELPTSATNNGLPFPAGALGYEAEPSKEDLFSSSAGYYPNGNAHPEKTASLLPPMHGKDGHRAVRKSTALNGISDSCLSVSTLLPPVRSSIERSEVDVLALERRLRNDILKQLQNDLGMEIQHILDERDAVIDRLKRENADLRNTLEHLSSATSTHQAADSLALNCMRPELMSMPYLREGSSLP